MLCLVILGYGHPVSGAVRKTVPNIDLLWRQYLNNDADRDPAVKYPYDHCFRSAAQKYDLPLTLLLAVARGESNFNPRAKSDRNCHGLMQIQWPGTARHLDVYRLSALYEPCTNIGAGARYLRELLDRYDGDLHLALAAYNYGPSRIKAGGSGSGSIPHGAKWYSGYIYHHLKYIIQDKTTNSNRNSGKFKSYRQQRRLTLITFRNPVHAEAYYAHLQAKAPSLNLSWYRMGLGRYRVVMHYSDSSTLEAGKKRLKKLGVIVNSR